MSPRSPVLSRHNIKTMEMKTMKTMEIMKTMKAMETMETMKTMNPLISAVEEEMTVASGECQDSVVPSVQKMKICNLLLND